MKKFIFLTILFFPFVSLASSSADIIAALNQDRASVNLPVLSVDSKLTQAAQTKAQDMVNKNYFSHTSPNGDFYDVFITNTGYIYSSSGENLYQGNDSAQIIISDWKNSELHRQNMESSDFTQIGVGQAGDYVVAMFGTPDQGLTVPTPKPTPTPKSLKMPKKITKPAPKPKPTPKPKVLPKKH